MKKNFNSLTRTWNDSGTLDWGISTPLIIDSNAFVIDSKEVSPCPIDISVKMQSFINS